MCWQPARQTGRPLMRSGNSRKGSSQCKQRMRAKNTTHDAHACQPPQRSPARPSVMHGSPADAAPQLPHEHRCLARRHCQPSARRRRHWLAADRTRRRLHVPLRLRRLVRLRRRSPRARRCRTCQRPAGRTTPPHCVATGVEAWRGVGDRTAGAGGKELSTSVS